MIACPECDLLQRTPDLPVGGMARRRNYSEIVAFAP